MTSSTEYKAKLPFNQRPIPRWVLSSAAFKRNVEALLDKAGLVHLPALPRWYCHKEIIRLASRMTVREVLNQPASVPLVRCQACLQAARAIHFGDSRLAKLACSAIPEGDVDCA